MSGSCFAIPLVAILFCTWLHTCRWAPRYAGPVLGDNDTIIMTACVVSNGTVLEVSQRIPAGKFSGTQTYRFLNISVGALEA